MADSRAQREAEVWVREVWLSEKFSQNFEKRKLELRSGGKFEFDAVSGDGRFAISISTSGGETTGGKKASPKLNKIRSDALFLLLADVDRRVLVFTDRLMFELCQREVESGRFPKEVEALLVGAPAHIEEALVVARLLAAKEVSPIQGLGG